MKTLRDLQLESHKLRLETKRLASIHLKERSVESFENWRMAKSRKLEVNAMIQSW